MVANPSDSSPPTGADAARAGAQDLGDITALDAHGQFPTGALDGDDDAVDYYRFTLTEAKKIGLGLRQQDANADLFLEDADGTVLYSSSGDGTAKEWISATLSAGTYFVRVEAQEAADNQYVFRYGVSDPDPEQTAEPPTIGTDPETLPGTEHDDSYVTLESQRPGVQGVLEPAVPGAIFPSDHFGRQCPPHHGSGRQPCAADPERHAVHRHLSLGHRSLGLECA